MMRRWLLCMVVVAFSSGWTVPLYLSVNWLIDWCRLEAAPVIYHQRQGGNSFPFLAEAEKWWMVGMIWLGLAVLAWSAAGARRFFMARPKAAA